MRLITSSNAGYIVELSAAEYEAALTLWPPPPLPAPLDEGAIIAWEQAFGREIARLNLPTFVSFAFLRSLAPNPFWGATRGWNEERDANVVYRLATWAEWCELLLSDGLKEHLNRVRGCGAKSYALLKQAVQTQRLNSGDSL